MSAPGFRHVEGDAPLPRDLRGGVVAIGNFDGVHRGHRAVLDQALQVAHETGRPAIALTFEPHPRAFFRPQAAPFRLTAPALKARLIQACGFDALVEQKFDAALADLTADAFVEDVLVARLGLGHVVTGFDFHFGKGRGGTPRVLRDAGARIGFPVDCVGEFRDEADDVVSSSRIRSLLSSGDLGEANGLLGYRFAVEAPVVGGERLGRTLGFPTANMRLPEAFDLAHGVYAVRLRRAGGALHDGVASFGRRPTVTDGGAPLLETYAFDFAGDLYDETCRVSFFSRLRGEEKFDALDALVVRMRRDEEEARAVLSGVKPLSGIDAALNF